MTEYEFHLTIDLNNYAVSYDKHVSKDHPFNTWKHSLFANYNRDGECVRRDYLLTYNKICLDNLEATLWVMDQIRGIQGILRVKIECGATSKKYGALYHEAHIKLKTDKEPSKTLNELCSVNLKKKTNWRTIRNIDYSRLVNTFKDLKLYYGNEIAEHEIESVIYDSAPELEYEWDK